MNFSLNDFALKQRWKATWAWAVGSASAFHQHSPGLILAGDLWLIHWTHTHTHTKQWHYQQIFNLKRILCIYSWYLKEYMYMTICIWLNVYDYMYMTECMYIRIYTCGIAVLFIYMYMYLLCMYMFVFVACLFV